MQPRIQSVFVLALSILFQAVAFANCDIIEHELIACQSASQFSFEIFALAPNKSTHQVGPPECTAIAQKMVKKSGYRFVSWENQFPKISGHAHTQVSVQEEIQTLNSLKKQINPCYWKMVRENDKAWYLSSSKANLASNHSQNGSRWNFSEDKSFCGVTIDQTVGIIPVETLEQCRQETKTYLDSFRIRNNDPSSYAKLVFDQGIVNTKETVR